MKVSQLGCWTCNQQVTDLIPGCHAFRH